MDVSTHLGVVKSFRTTCILHFNPFSSQLNNLKSSTVILLPKIDSVKILVGHIALPSLTCHSEVKCSGLGCSGSPAVACLLPSGSAGGCWS